MLPIFQGATHNRLAGAADYPDSGQRERERESKKRRVFGMGVVRNTNELGGGCNRNIIWQFGNFPCSAR
jgi:hypothetical protein